MLLERMTPVSIKNLPCQQTAVFRPTEDIVEYRYFLSLDAQVNQAVAGILSKYSTIFILLVSRL